MCTPTHAYGHVNTRTRKECIFSKTDVLQFQSRRGGESLERVAEELMGRRKWKHYQDVQIARNLPLSQDPLAPSSDTQEPQSEEEDRPMIATAETLQRNSSASDLNSPLDPANNRQDTAIQQHQDKTKDQDLSSPIHLDEDSKDNEKGEVEQNSTTLDDTAPQKEDTSVTVTAGVQSILKIKTIEEINTVSSDTGVGESAGCGPTETILESLIKRSSSGPPRKQQPADWTPQDKCYFCVDGELVRPTANAQEAAPPPQHQPSPVESESESSSSRSAASPPRSSQFLLNSQAQAQAQALAHFLQLQQGGTQPTMEQMQSIAASLAAVAAFRGGAPLGAPITAPMQTSLQPALQPAMLPAWYLAAAQQHRSAATPDRCSSGADKGTSSPGASPSGEQPLDLSAKGGSGGGSAKVDHGMGLGQPQSALEARLAGLRMPPIDHKQIFHRAKPRLAAAGGRRAYSEAELQMALRDIQSGKLGTRRAAVIYNIPRSTLRNKVYKMASEKEREARLPGIGQHSAVADREDSNDIGDDDNDSIIDEDKEEDRDMTRPELSMDDVLRYSQIENSNYGTSENLRALLQKGGQKFFDMESPKRDTASDLWPGMEHGAMGSYIQSLLLAGGLGAPVPKMEDNHTMPMMPEIIRLIEQRNNILKEQLMKKEHNIMNNGKPLDLLEDDQINKRILSRQSSSASSVITRNDRTTPGRKTDSPDDIAMDITDHGESRESPSNVILKIPSFKPLATGPNSGKNGGESFQDPATPPLPYFSHSPHSEVSSAPRSSSPSHGHPKGVFSLREVIAKSINEKFTSMQQGGPVNHVNDNNRMSMGSPGIDAMESLNAFKRARLSPPMGVQGISVIKNLGGHDLSRSFGNNSANQNQQNNSAGGKGTRPKRGKYRNYDRDSLVEAVKAVQRGEMSVHRAGSFYGVPHSTLEYKVKERHLMRPRKREPKNPVIEEQKSSMASGSKLPDSTNRTDKPKLPQKPMSKPPNFPSSSPNGLKMPPIFDGSLPLGYNPPPFPFWPHAPSYHGIPVDFGSRNPGTSTGFSSNPESFFASQMMQRLQEESARHPGQTQKLSNSLTANGSFLEGIIRSTLEQPAQRGRSALEDQSGSDESEAGRRRLRPDDLLLAEEMRETARRLRAREVAVATTAASSQQPPSHPS